MHGWDIRVGNPPKIQPIRVDLHIRVSHSLGFSLEAPYLVISNHDHALGERTLYSAIRC